MEVIFIEGRREGYGIDQIRRTLTVGELIAYLSDHYDEDTPLYLSTDGGYTYGSITESSFSVDYIDESEDDEE